MEGKNESKHTPEDKVAIRVPNIRIPAGYSRDISAAILDYQSECNAILKEQSKRIKELEGRIRVETLLFEQLSEMKKEREELNAEVDRLTKEKSELVSVLTDFTAWCEYPDVSKVLGMSQATIFHTAKDLLTRIK